MKKTTLFLALSLICLFIYGQGITNNGAAITITPNAYVNITGTGGHFTNTSGTIDLDGFINLEGNWVNNFGSVFSNVETTPDGIVTFSGANAQSIGGSATTAFENVIMNKTNTLSVTVTSSVTGDLTLSGGTLSPGSNTLNVAGDWTNNATFTCGTSTVVFNGSALQNIKSGGSAFNNVTFDNSTAGTSDISLSDAMTIGGAGTFSQGIVNYSGSKLIFSDNSSCNGGSASSFVNCVDDNVLVTKIGDDAFKFPVGEVSGSNIVWAPVDIAAPSASTTITANYDFAAPPDNWNLWYMCDPSVLDHVSSVEHWNMGTGGPTPNVTLYWKDAVRSGITNLSDLVVAHYELCSSSNKWVSYGGSAVDDGSGTGHVTNLFPIGSYSPITFGTKKNTNPLPIELTEFTSTCSDNGVLLKWTTATETNNDYFTIERSEDAATWEEIENIDGAGNSNQTLYYNYTDRHSASQTEYYRLKQTDFDGQFAYSPVISIQCIDNTNMDVIIYPNPFKENVTLIINNFEYPQANITVYDILGNKISVQDFSTIENNRIFTTFDLKTLACGMYFVEVRADDFKKEFKIVKN